MDRQQDIQEPNIVLLEFFLVCLALQNNFDEFLFALTGHHGNFSRFSHQPRMIVAECLIVSITENRGQALCWKILASLKSDLDESKQPHHPEQISSRRTISG